MTTTASIGINAPRTVRRYMAAGTAPRDGRRSHLWTTFVRNHASAVLACDFFVAITASFRVVYIVVVLDVGTRWIQHWNVTSHPTADWTAQQFGMVMSDDGPHRFLIHDHDSIYADHVDRNGSRITITGAHTRAWDPAFPIRLPTLRRRPAIGFAKATASSPFRFLVVFITSTFLSQGLREVVEGRRDYLRTTGVWTWGDNTYDQLGELDAYDASHSGAGIRSDECRRHRRRIVSRARAEGGRQRTIPWSSRRRARGEHRWTAH
jgi:hypothetical protein